MKCFMDKIEHLCLQGCTRRWLYEKELQKVQPRFWIFFFFFKDHINLYFVSTFRALQTSAFIAPGRRWQVGKYYAFPQNLKETDVTTAKLGLA